MDFPALDAAPTRDGAPGRVRVICAVSIVTAIASAVLPLWLAAGDGDGGYRGIELRCVYRFEDGGGDTSTCDRVPMGARANVFGQLSLAVASAVGVLRRRTPIVWLRATVAISISLTVFCYVFMRSWGFGLSQRLL